MFFNVFFFFKQKTAYEMRISDWSSDVCSSDLPILEAIGSLFLFLWAVQHEGSRALRAIEELEAQIRHIDDSADLGLLQQHPPRGLAVGEIGRPSCRDRVCQYV